MHALRLSLFTLVALSLAGCMSTGPDFPQAPAGFAPRVVYDVQQDRAWSAVVAAMSKNNIAIANTSKEAGQISTDYIAGSHTIYALGLAGTGASRYKYNVFLSKEGAGKTRIGVKAILENTLSGAAGSTQYRDLSAENPEIIARLEGWMYQQIEASM